MASILFQAARHSKKPPSTRLNGRLISTLSLLPLQSDPRPSYQIRHNHRSRNNLCTTFRQFASESHQKEDWHSQLSLTERKKQEERGSPIHLVEKDAEIIEEVQICKEVQVIKEVKATKEAHNKGRGRRHLQHIEQEREKKRYLDVTIYDALPTQLGVQSFDTKHEFNIPKHVMKELRRVVVWKSRKICVECRVSFLCSIGI